MEKILIISEICDYKNKNKRHFSITKGFPLLRVFSITPGAEQKDFHVVFPFIRI